MFPDISFSPLDISLSAGWLGGERREYVYDTISGRKLSQLNWKIRSVPVLKAGITPGVGYRLTVDIGGWASLSSEYGVIDDYDWLGT
ncbi:omptin family outer membrane protease [Salmonella enterica]|nr:omptin family outer membrane protease [Salmonella enterica]ECH1726011.1 omptin family outer membrane protease [Salmonella enterica]